MNKTVVSLTNAKRSLEIALDYVRSVLESEHFPTPENADQRISNRRNLVYAFDYLELVYGEVEYSLNRLSKLAVKTNQTANQNETEKQ